MPLVLWSEYEPFELSMISGYLKPNTVFYDIGANIGIHSIVASEKVRPNGVVVAFEPDERNLKLLRLNLEENSAKNVIVFDTALSDRDGVSTLALDNKNWGKSSLSPANVTPGALERTVRTTTRRLDRVIEENGLPLPDVMKIDIEGAEGLLVRGASNLLSMNRDLIFFCEVWPRGQTNLGTSVKWFFSNLLQMGFRVDYVNKETNRLERFCLDQCESTDGFDILATKQKV